MKLATWNVGWCGRRSARNRAVRGRIDDVDADIWCFTEVDGALHDGGHGIAAGADYGYRRIGARRKVALWSRAQWRSVDSLGDARLPPGRFICGKTDRGNGEALKVMGVCIPWRMAHVASGRRDRAPWQDHLAYLAAFGAIVKRQSPDVIMGDFNQRMPWDSSYGVAKTTHAALALALSGYRIVTQSLHPKLIDHIALRADHLPGAVALIERDSAGRPLTDHYGASLDLPTP